MGFGLRFKERLDDATADEIDKLVKFLKQFLLLEHNEDGTHIVSDPTTNVAAADVAYVTVGNTSSLSAERALTGTANQVTVTDNGANSTVQLGTPQNIGTGSSPTFAAVTLSGLTSGRVPIAGTSGLIGDDADLTFATDTLTATKISTTSVTDSGLTSGRVVLASTAGLLADDSDLTFSTDTLTATRMVASSSRTLGGATAAATTCYSITKKVTSIADNTATDILTVTIPNANHAATIRLLLLSSNGGTDAFESSRTASGSVVVARTTGANAVAAASTIDAAQIATVSGGATHTLAYSVSAISGAVGDPNTFTIQVTIDDSGNLGSNQLVVFAELLNAESTGVTIA